MRRNFMHNKKVRMGTLTVVLIALVIASTVLLNTLFATLAKRYTWYVSMNEYGNYDVTDTCFDIVEDLFSTYKDSDGKEKKVSILFCNLEEELLDDSTEKYVYDTACELQERFPENIEIKCYDIWTNPSNVKEYAKVYNASTGEYDDSALKSTNVIVTCGDYYRVYALTEFFVFADGSTDNVWAYDGEQVFASAILHALDTEEHIVCLTSNHGEAYYDYELLYLLDDAGYTLYYIDLYQDEIPEDCHLIISYNPNTDLIDDELSEKSEVGLLREFLSDGGNTFLVFLENGTPKLDNYEKLLKEYGVQTAYSGSFRQMVQDGSASLTSDGYTIYAETAKNSKAEALISDSLDKLVFKDATALIPAEEGYTASSDGTYVSGDGMRVMYPILTSSETAQCWVNGKQVDSGRMTLATLTECKNETGTSYVGVFSSADMMQEDYLQSAVFDNGNLIKHLLCEMGKADTTEGLTIKPFQSTDISSVTTSDMLTWTLVLSLTPLVILSVTCVVVMVRRKNR